MTEPATTETAPLSLWARAVGVVTSPKATFANIVAVPRPFGILFLSALIMGIATTAPQFTENGRLATLDMQMRSMERMGMTITPELQQQLEERSHNKLMTSLGILGPLITLPIITLIFTAIFWAAFNVALGGTASFKQVLAVVAHSNVITVIGLVIGAPLQMMQTKMSMGGPFNLGALAPMLDENSTMASFLSALSVFTIWGLIVTAIGLAVLYKRNTRNIAITLMVGVLGFMYGVTALFGSLFGRG